jgi:integrase
MTEPGANKTFGKWRRPGFLLEPLGWVQDRLRQAIEVEPRLVELLFDLDHARMHLTAIALAHMNDDVTPNVALILLQESKKTVLNLSVGHRPVGIGRALRRLPPNVLAAEIYRKLVDLLDDSVPAKFLHHIGSITDPLITGIHRLPAGLRTAAIMAMFNQIDDMIWFVDGLRVLASRAGLRFDTLAHQIGTLNQPDQIAATIRQVDPHLFGTHSLRRTKATLIYRRTGNLRAVQLLLGHTKIESTVRYLGIEVDDAFSIAEQVDL